MKQIKTLALVILLLVLHAPLVLAQATTTHSSDRQDVNLVIQSPCQGSEPVALAATLAITSQVTIDPAGGFHLQSLLHMQGNGLGMESGDRYLVSQLQKSELQSNSSPPFTFTSTAKFSINRLGKGIDYQALVLVHYTVDEDGNVKASVNNSTFVCK